MYAAKGIFTPSFGSNVHIGSLEALPSLFPYGSLVLQIATQHSTSFWTASKLKREQSLKNEDMC
jgi:hypothetical protein